MYLHLGLDAMVDTKKIIGIFDLQTTQNCFLKALKIKKKENCVSYILTDKKIYLSEISSVTLKKRADNLLKQDSIYFKGDQYF